MTEREKGEVEVTPAMLDAGLAVVRDMFGDFHDTNSLADLRAFLARVYGAMERAKGQSG